ncbi:MAG: hypothetical protein XU09_C0008G0316 [Thaumarchaeota archaeon CSP1-1]|nr:MAG: hypothetical protein XU09_C0008G0316 [Thaumarchaeota archaeon CSP1-1]
MALVFNNPSYEAILRLSENPTAEEELYTMTFWELEVLNERINDIANKNSDDKKLFAKLMRLKLQSTLMGESARKRDGEYR